MKGYHSTLFFILYCGLLAFTGTLWGMVLSALAAWVISYPLNTYVFTKRLKDPTSHAVLITGCSSGLGLETATHLASQGFNVFATVRKSSDGRKLLHAASDMYGVAAAQRILPVLMDVTKPEEIKKCEEYVRTQCEERGWRFLSLINNAGYGETAPLEIIPMENFKQNYEVNVFGPVAVSQAFLPLIRRHNNNDHSGRLLFLGSGIGLVTVPTVAAYCSSKTAIEAIVDAFRVELRPWGIQVVDIVSGRMGTEFGKKAQQSGEELVLQNDEATRRVGGSVMSVYKQDVERMKLGESISPAQDSMRIAKAIETALVQSKPYARYFAGWDCNLLIPVLTQLPEGITDTLFEGMFRWFRSPGKPLDLNPRTTTLQPVS